MQVHWTWRLSNVRLHLWIFKNGIPFFLNFFIVGELRKLGWYHAFCWAKSILINWIIQNHIGMRIGFRSPSSVRWYRNIKLLSVLIINLLLMPQTRITHLLAMVVCFLRGHIIFFYLHIISSLAEVFFLAYRLILDIESASGLFLLREDLGLLGMYVLIGRNSFDYIHCLGVNVCCGLLEACSFISSILIGEQLHDIVIWIFVFA